MHCWTDTDQSLLLELLATDTVTPMESDSLGNLAHAQSVYADHAKRIGFEVDYFAPPAASILEEPDVPSSVREKAGLFGAKFFDAQPNLVLRMGNHPAHRTLLFNFHMDTVAGFEPVLLRDGKIYGRGAADAKGLGVAVLMAVRRALQLHPGLGDGIGLIIQSVGGEEGGAMGVYGTRLLAAKSCYGRLNVVCEPTDFAYFDRTTSAMTARIAVQGEGSTDDEPAQGQNATILLAAITDMLTREISPAVFNMGAKMCIGGLHTGTMHNRVYGSGCLLLNFAYPSLEIARELEALVENAFTNAVERFQNEYARYAAARAAAAAARDICSLTWVKRRLPVLANRDCSMENLLAGIGIPRHDGNSSTMPFSCDAMWLQGPDRFTIVFGPGHLGRNKTHAVGEFMDLADLDLYAHQLSRLILAFADHVS